MVGTERLELSRVAPSAPQTEAYTYFATSPPKTLLSQISFLLIGKLLSLSPVMSRPSPTTRYIGQAQTVAECRSLTMAIRAEEPEIFSAVIIPVTVDVINGQHQGFAIPGISDSAHRASKRNSCFNHRAAQLIRFFRMRERIA